MRHPCESAGDEEYAMPSEVTREEKATSLQDVRDFWTSHPCNSRDSEALERRTYFEEIEAVRYSVENHMPHILQAERYRGRDVLEIGCGIGTDGRRFAAAGARYTGINLDLGSLELSREAFKLFSLPGSIQQANGEALPFPTKSFDHVYSFGVIHH